MSRLTSDSDLGVDFIQFLKINDFSGDWGGINKDTFVVQCSIVAELAVYVCMYTSVVTEVDVTL